MAIKETIALTVALTSLIIIIIPFVYEVWEPFKSYPKFGVDLKLISFNNSTFARLIVENKGDSQAKDVTVFVLSEEPVKILKSVCPEGKSKFEESSVLEIIFKKMSTNIECIVDFSSLVKGNIFKVVITADEVPGYELEIDPPLDFSRPIELQLLKEQIQSLRESEERFREKQFYNDVILLVSLSTAIAVSWSLFYGFRMAKKTKEREEISFTKSLRENQTQLTSEFDRTNSELEFLTGAISTKLPDEIPLETLRRRDYLVDRISQLVNERDRIQSSLSSGKDLHSLIGEFFENWGNLEQVLVDLYTKINEKRLKYPNSNYVIKNLHQKGMLTKPIMEELQFLRKYRNEVVHVGKQTSKQELESKIPTLKNLISEIQKIKPEIPPTVVIPKGSSVPGCEENDQCFIPSEKTSKVNQTIVWNNEDSAAHTITSGTPEQGSDGKFDSSMIMAGADFSHKFSEKGRYPYFCMVHPWQKGIIIIE